MYPTIDVCNSNCMTFEHVFIECLYAGERLQLNEMKTKVYLNALAYVETVHFDVHVKLLYLHPYTLTDLKLKGSAASGFLGCISVMISPGLLTQARWSKRPGNGSSS